MTAEFEHHSYGRSHVACLVVEWLPGGLSILRKANFSTLPSRYSVYHLQHLNEEVCLAMNSIIRPVESGGKGHTVGCILVDGNMFVLGEQCSHYLKSTILLE